MAKSFTLIHTALKSESAPLCRHFGLRQQETSPFRVHRNRQLLLLEAGPGREATRKGLEYALSRYPLRRAVNFGTAGCNDKSVEPGSLFAVYGGMPGMKQLPLISVNQPARSCHQKEPCLIDMEGEAFLHVMQGRVPAGELHILKVVSDYLDDEIPSKDFVDRLVGRSLHLWDELADPLPARIRQVMSLSPEGILSDADRKVIIQSAVFHSLSFQEIKHLVDMAADFSAWDTTPMAERLTAKFSSRSVLYRSIRGQWDDERSTLKSYRGFKGNSGKSVVKKFMDVEREQPGFGRCPVASEKTRCCNLLTLDVVEGCGFDCSYCSIRYFYDRGSVGFNRNLLSKIRSIELDPQRQYHIGTGQSSDSLMWGNREGILEGLLNFAAENPNVILELKTKSNNISWLLKQHIPANVVCTWSLNPQIIIDNEEHLCASLQRRIESARAIADKGNLVGFHFHPMLLYDEWKVDYSAIFMRLLDEFSHKEVLMISFGTLTFTRPVIKKMRESSLKSRILQMPMEEAGGKLSYPLDLKRDMFRFAYKSFSPWHDTVFFYLCMEDESLWMDVFERCYESNELFEEDMINFYMGKISAF